MYKKKTRKVLLWLTSLRVKKKTDEEISKKKVTWGLLDNYDIVSNEQKN